MATDLDECHGGVEVGQVEVDLLKVANGGDCNGNGNGIVHEEEIDGEEKENGDAVQTDHDVREEAVVEEICLKSENKEERDEIQVEEKSNVDVNAEGKKAEINGSVEDQDQINSDEIKDEEEIENNGSIEDREKIGSEEVKEGEEIENNGSIIEHDIIVSDEIEEGEEIENNGSNQEQDKIGSDEIVQENREPIIESAGIVDSGLNHPDGEEIVEEHKDILDVGEVDGSDSDQLKVEDQAKVDSGLDSKESEELDSQSEATDSVESKLLQPIVGENTGEEISKPQVSEQTEETRNINIPVVEVTESESHQLKKEEEIEEPNKLVASAEVCQDTQGIATEAVKTEPCCPDDGKECKAGELADDIVVDEPSTQQETENLSSGIATCPSDKVQADIDDINETDETGGSVDVLPVEQTFSDTEVTNDSAECQDKSLTDPIGHIESETVSINDHNENTKLSSVVELKSETAVQDVSAENEDGLSAGAVASRDLELEVVNAAVERDESLPTASVDEEKSEVTLGNISIEKDDSVPSVPDNVLESGTNATNGFTGDTNLPADSAEDSQPKSEGGDSPHASKDVLSGTGAVKLESLVSNGPIVNSDRKLDGINDVKSIENEKDQCGDSNGKSICENDGIKGIVSNDTLSPSPEDSAAGAVEIAKVDSEVEKRPFRFLIRIPRYSDDNIKNQIELAQKQVEEKTRNRDDLRSTIQSKRVSSGEFRNKFEAARSEERASRDALNAKRGEMDSVLSVISRMKNATSIDDIDDRIHNMEHRIEHETVPLKEEKQLIREIKQLKHLRDQLSSSLGQQAESQPTSDERVKIEERFKLLKQEMESRRKEVIRLEGITKAAWKIYFDENEKLKALQAQYRDADDLRQEAYVQLQNLKKQLYEKNKYFRSYKENTMKAEDYACARDREALHRLCVNQVETIMELWNKNDEFRNEYVRCNKLSTLRRLRTEDGRSLGPDEESPVLRNGPDGRVDNSILASANKIDYPLLSASEKGKSVGSVGSSEPKNLKADTKAVINLEQKHKTAKSKTITKPAVLENSIATVSGREDKQENDEENKRNKEEEELARKEEELRKEEEAAKLKEHLRLQEKIKAKEAEERKKRNAEKAKAKAALRAQKEAELKEKEREKRAKKKERKKEKVEAATVGGDEAESSSKSENIQPETTEEPDIKEKPKTVVKRPQKAALLAKQTKPKVIPPPLRSRGKKRMQQYMWIILVVIVLIALFLVGNIGFSMKFGLPSFGF